jgi:hypothetical protein
MSRTEGIRGKWGFTRSTAKQAKKKLEILSLALISNLKYSIFCVGYRLLAFHNKI